MMRLIYYDEFFCRIFSLNYVNLIIVFSFEVYAAKKEARYISYNHKIKEVLPSVYK